MLSFGVRPAGAGKRTKGPARRCGRVGRMPFPRLERAACGLAPRLRLSGVSAQRLAPVAVDRAYRRERGRERTPGQRLVLELRQLDAAHGGPAGGALSDARGR